jgi:predicted PurR-regulated permease PerM
MVKHQQVNTIVLLLMVTAISALFLTMIRQFLMAIFMAGLFSAMTAPIHNRLTRRLHDRENLASILIIIAIVCLILIPLGFLIGVVINQAVHVAQSVTPWIESFIEEPGVLSEYVAKMPYYEEVLPYRDTILEKAGQVVGLVSNLLINSLSSLTKVTLNALFNIVIMLYVMFYFMTMGDVLLKKIMYYLPMTHEDEERLLLRFTSVTRATMKSTLIIGILQGGICGFAFFLAGIPGAVFWGTVMAVLSTIPAVGTAIVWVPALIILAIGGDVSGAVILGILCGAVAGNLDNLLRPRLVGQDTEMHDLFVLFGTLGGITLFGVLGIIIGPIIAALFITIWEIYGDTFQDYLPEVGSLARLSQGQGMEDSAPEEDMGEDVSGEQETEEEQA